VYLIPRRKRKLYGPSTLPHAPEVIQLEETLVVCDGAGLGSTVFVDGVLVLVEGWCDDVAARPGRKNNGGLTSDNEFPW